MHFWHDFFPSLFCLFVLYTMKRRDQDKMVSLSSSPVYFLISGESTVKNLMLSIWQYTCTLALLETNCYLQWYMFVSIYFGKCCLFVLIMIYMYDNPKKNAVIFLKFLNYAGHKFKCISKRFCCKWIKNFVFVLFFLFMQDICFYTNVEGFTCLRT